MSMACCSLYASMLHCSPPLWQYKYWWFLPGSSKVWMNKVNTFVDTCIIWNLICSLVFASIFLYFCKTIIIAGIVHTFSALWILLGPCHWCVYVFRCCFIIRCLSCALGPALEGGASGHAPQVHDHVSMLHLGSVVCLMHPLSPGFDLLTFLLLLFSMLSSCNVNSLEGLGTLGYGTCQAV